MRWLDDWRALGQIVTHRQQAPNAFLRRQRMDAGARTQQHVGPERVGEHVLQEALARKRARLGQAMALVAPVAHQLQRPTSERGAQVLEHALHGESIRQQPALGAREFLAGRVVEPADRAESGVSPREHNTQQVALVRAEASDDAQSATRVVAEEQVVRIDACQIKRNQIRWRHRLVGNANQRGREAKHVDVNGVGETIQD
jgi:hypothetical protein